ncbi:MAG: hypothetical protein KDC14_18125 [Planctomycetes bacterium]|nr:hypothetical protein [Planctomycetota bacterium]
MNHTIKPLGWCAAALVLSAVSGRTNALAQSAELDPSWTYASGTSGWIPDTVSVGDEGRRVFSAVGDFGSSAHLFSESANPISTDTNNELSYRHVVDSSETSERRAWLHYHSPSSLTPATAELRVYDSDSSTPTLTYAFPFQVGQPLGGTQISSDGSRVCAWVYDLSAHRTAVAVFEGSATTPSIYTTVDTFVEPSHAMLSRDGSRLYMETGSKTFIVDTTTGDVVQWMYNFTTIGRAHAISPNGTVFAQSTSTNDLKVYRQQGASFSAWFTHHVDGSYLCSRASFSGDGTRLVATFDGYADQRIRVVVLDLRQETPIVEFDYEMVGGGSLDLATSDVAVNRTATRFFVGTWGDESGLVPEVIVFGKDASGSWTKTHHVELSGSVRDLDIDSEGEHLAVASKTVHATLIGGGGRYDLYELPSESGMRLIGTPTAGGSVEVRVACPPDKTGLLLASSGLAATPASYPGVGQLYLERDGLSFLARTQENGSGELVFTVDLGSAQAGDVIYVQGLVFGPRRLSPGALAITVTN